MRENICIIGPVCAGKTTCISLLDSDEHIKISCTDLINDSGIEIANDQLLNDDVILSSILDIMDVNPDSIIFDGFPQNLHQLVEFIQAGNTIDRVFYLNASYETIYQRAYERLVCPNPNCRLVFNRNSAPSINGLFYCPNCHTVLGVRSDDNVYSLDERYNRFYDNFDEIAFACCVFDIPIVEIDAEKDPLTICNEILVHL